MSDDWKDKAHEEGGEQVPPILHHPLSEPDEPDVVESAPRAANGAVVSAHARRQPEENADQPGLYLYGIARARGWRGFERRNRELQRIRYRDIEALVRPTTFQLPEDTDALVTGHQQAIEVLMRRSTVLPAPFGIVFKGRRALIRFLQDQYLVFDEGLSLLDGHWELRLHVSCTGVGEVEDELSDEAHRIYGELRRFARAAVPFPAEERRILSAAFLVERTSWVEFIERIEDFGAQHTGLIFDVTGPWPAYDFVRVVA